ncbi:MarR family transcriptional regulator [Actinospica durhamensis]|uniref:MarR family transcriptional regulator n=1 Tax=Actinospica durhamensis TaxID=1508375 RepID=A0A941IPX2_9ACTN|nr:MarR family transcriptional regulator [Actinospica durhamensis]MBR7837015.1 MarR family transcriptional regulator [Actinospica durhamensis]
MNPDTPTSSQDAASAQAAWAGMQAFVTGHDRRRDLRVELDLGAGKAELLIKLAQAPMTLREIAQAVDVDPSAATVGVDRLERRGLVRRGAHPDDSRRKLVHLTEAGLRAAATAERILADPPPELAVLDPRDLAALTRIFATLNAGPSSAGAEAVAEPEAEAEQKPE